MAEGLIKFTYREGAKTPPVISEWLRAKPDGMSYPEYLNVVLLECLSDEGSRERVAEGVAAGASQASSATLAGTGVTADEIRSIVSEDGDLTREAIRGIAEDAPARGEDEDGEGIPADALSTAGAEELAQSLIEAVERDGAATREAMESLSQMLSEPRGEEAASGDEAGEDGGASAPSDADLERIVTRLKDSIITDGQKTREMLSNLLDSLPASDGGAVPVAAAGAAGAAVASVGEGSELREMLRSDMLDMVTAIREDGQTLREDIGNVVAEAAGGQSLSFDDDTAQFFGNLHRGIANILSRVDAMQVQMAQVQQAVTENRTAIWEDGLKQEKVIRQSYDEVIEALDRIGDGSVRERETDALPEGLDFSVPDADDEADSASEGMPAEVSEATEVPIPDAGDEGVAEEGMPVSAFLGESGEGHVDAMGQDDLRRAVDMLFDGDASGHGQPVDQPSESETDSADEGVTEPGVVPTDDSSRDAHISLQYAPLYGPPTVFGSPFDFATGIGEDEHDGEADSGSEGVAGCDDAMNPRESDAIPEEGEGGHETPEATEVDVPEADPVTTLGRMFGINRADVPAAGERVATRMGEGDGMAPLADGDFPASTGEQPAEAEKEVEELPAAPMADPREAFLNEPVTHAPATSWSADSSAPYGGIAAPTPEPEDDEEDEDKGERGRLGDMLRSLLG